MQLDDLIKGAQVAAYPGTPPLTPIRRPMPYSLRTSSRSSTIPGPDPFRTAPGAYVWNPLDDVFIAVSQWNRTHSGSTPKIIQLLLNAGFNAPGWVFTNIDRSVCGGRANCTGSCDGLFMTPLPPVSSHCGYTTIFYRTESTPIQQQPFPMPWNFAYASANRAGGLPSAER